MFQGRTPRNSAMTEASLVNNNNNKSICKVQNPVRREYYNHVCTHTHARTHARTHTHTHTHARTHARTHAHTHAHTHTHTPPPPPPHTHTPHTHTHEYTDYTQFAHNLNRQQTDLRRMKTAARNGKHGRSIVWGK